MWPIYTIILQMFGSNHLSELLRFLRACPVAKVRLHESAVDGENFHLRHLKAMPMDAHRSVIEEYCGQFRPFCFTHFLAGAGPVAIGRFECVKGTRANEARIGART